MPATGTLLRRSHIADKYAELIAGIILGIIVTAALIFPRALPFFYFTLAIMAAVELGRAGQFLRVFSAPGYFWIFAVAFTAWCMATTIWSVVPFVAAGKVLFLATVFFAAWIIIHWLTTISATMSIQLKLSLLCGFLFGAAFLAVEVLTDQTIKRFILENFEIARPSSSKHIRFENGEIVSIPPYQLNRSIAVLNIFYWPAILLALKLFKANMRGFLIAAIVVLTALATYYSVHESSMIAFVLSTVVFTLAYFTPRIGRVTVATGWIVAILLILPAIHAAYGAKLYNAPWIPDTAQARIVFWAHTAQQYVKNPIIGVGVRTTKVMSEANKNKDVLLPNHPYRMRTGRHGHNIYLQTWYELGAIGAGLLLLLGLAFLSKAHTLAPGVKPFAFASFSVGATLAAFTWGMWQTWYIAMFAMAVAIMLIAGHQIRDTKPD